MKVNEMSSTDIMCDLETTGIRAGCGILSIGACTFDLTSTFYERIDIQSCHHYGLRDDPETIMWWSKQDPIAKAEAFSGTKDLLMVLGKFSDWFRRHDGQIFIWGNGADFDLPILTAAFEAVCIKQPWKPYNGRCYRTLKNLYKDVKMREFEGLKHSALADAKNQAVHARDILRIHFAD